MWPPTLNVLVSTVAIIALCVSIIAYMWSWRTITLPAKDGVSYDKWIASDIGKEGQTIVLWLFHGYVPVHNAGSEVMIHAMNKRLLDEGITVIVACPQYPQVVYEGIRLMDARDAHLLNTIAAQASVVGTHHHMTYHACQLAEKHKKPVIEVIHDAGRDRKPETYPVVKDRLNFIYNSNWMQKRYSYTGVKSIVIRPPVDWREYETVSTKEYVTLINVNGAKGGEQLIQIAKAMPDIQFLGVCGAYGKQITTNSLPNIRYEDHTPDIHSVYARTRILLMPSSVETWGRTAVEAMSSGIPVIATPTSGLVECLGDAGLFAKRNNINEWVRLIRKLTDDMDYYRKVGDKCRIRAHELDPKPDLDKFVEFVRGLATSSQTN